MKTTLSEIRKHTPSKEILKKLFKFLGKSKPDNEPLEFSTILRGVDIKDAIWCLRVLRGDHSERIMRFGCDMAEIVLPVYEARSVAGNVPKECIERSRLFSEGKIELSELVEASDAGRYLSDDLFSKYARLHGEDVRELEKYYGGPLYAAYAAQNIAFAYSKSQSLPYFVSSERTDYSMWSACKSIENAVATKATWLPLEKKAEDAFLEYWG